MDTCAKIGDECSCSPRAQRTPKKTSSESYDYDLIEVVNTLQNKLSSSGHTLDISLPQIVVVGCQSAGKSSVLESIVGREFLPRGSGVVTRRPTVVQLQESDDEYAVFLHKPDEKFRNFDDVRNEIHKETLRDPGPVGFSSQPISLKIYSPKALKLTLVDLPGLIRVVVGDQSEDSITQVRNMVLQYINQPNSLILAISPANQDIANSDALEIAKIVDPERVRTIGVLTKLDLMDEGTDVRDVLENKKIPLKRGYVGVLNRSQRDIDEGKDFDYCLDKERTFFESAPCYRHLAHRMGTPYLKTFLNKQLHDHIKRSLPGVRQELSQKLSTYKKKLKDFSTKIGCMSENNSIQFYMIKLMQNFTDGILIDVFGYSEKVRMNELAAGAKINYLLNNRVPKLLKTPQIPDVAQLLIAIANLHGIRNGMSLPSLTLQTVVNQVMSQYTDPLNSLVDSIAETLLSSVEKSSEVIDSYPNLKNEMLNFIRKCIEEAAFDTKEALEKHLEADKYFVNTYHPDFTFPEIESGEKFFPMRLWDDGNSSCKISGFTFEEAEALENLAANKNVTENANYIAKTVEKYLIIQHTHLGNTVIKYIAFYLIKTVMDYIKGELIPTVLESADRASILEDCEKDFNEIEEIKELCKCIEDAMKAVQEF